MLDYKLDIDQLMNKPMDNGDFNGLFEVISLLKKLESPYYVQVEKAYHRLNKLESSKND